MSQRAAKFVSALFASLLAGTVFATVSHSAPEAADSCLAGPKGALPQGGHWYYRVDRATKRHCWYIGDEKEKLSRAAPENSPPADDAVSPPASTPKTPAAQRSIANARAELPMPQIRVEPDSSLFAGRRAPVADAARPDNDPPANMTDADIPRSVFASRWPDPAGVGSSAGPAPSTAQPQVVAQLIAPPGSESAPVRAAPAVTLAAADAASDRPSGSIQQLLVAIVGALALAGLIASAIFRFGGARRARRRDVRGARRVNWDSARTHRLPLADEARAAASIGDMPKHRPARGARAADDDRAAQMLARLQRSSAS